VVFSKGFSRMRPYAASLLAVVHRWWLPLPPHQDSHLRFLARVVLWPHMKENLVRFVSFNPWNEVVVLVGSPEA